MTLPRTRRPGPSDTLLEPETTDDDVARLAKGADQALAMIAAGATRIGTSHTAAILNGVHDE